MQRRPRAILVAATRGRLDRVAESAGPEPPEGVLVEDAERVHARLVIAPEAEFEDRQIELDDGHPEALAARDRLGHDTVGQRPDLVLFAAPAEDCQLEDLARRGYGRCSGRPGDLLALGDEGLARLDPPGEQLTPGQQAQCARQHGQRTLLARRSCRPPRRSVLRLEVEQLAGRVPDQRMPFQLWLRTELVEVSRDRAPPPVDRAGV